MAIMVGIFSHILFYQYFHLDMKQLLFKMKLVLVRKLDLLQFYNNLMKTIISASPGVLL